jgi:hypothetical protein
MRRLSRDIQPADEWFTRTIRHISVASACRAHAETCPEAARGLLKAGEHHSFLAGLLLAQNWTLAHGHQEGTVGVVMPTGLGGRTGGRHKG